MDKRKKQRWFDRAVNGFAAQGFRRSVTGDNDACLYRGPDNMKCAVGHLVRDCDYRTEYEGSLTAALDRGMLILGHKPDAKATGFLYELQVCHDYSENPTQMKRGLIYLAKRHGLKIHRKLRGV